MRINYSQQGITVSYSLTSILSLSLFIALKFLRFKISLLTGMSVLSSGALLFFFFWSSLAYRLGICPGLYHSTLCIPTFKQEKFIFKSSRVCEYGILNGFLSSLYCYFWSNATNSFFLIGTSLLSYIALFIGRSDYLVSDFLGITLITLSVTFLTNLTSFPEDWIFELILFL